MSTVAPPISDRVITRVFLRPMRSPMCEKIKPPSGRMKKVSENVRYDSISPTTGSLVGKNTLLNTSAAVVAYRK
ncbi:hypothetical protein D3C72_1657320 [compost metagenome]